MHSLFIPKFRSWMTFGRIVVHSSSFHFFLFNSWNLLSISSMSISSLFCPGAPPLEGRDADGMSGRSGRLLIPAEGGGPDFDEPCPAGGIEEYDGGAGPEFCPG